MAVGWEGCSGPQLAFLISRWGGETHFPVGGGPGWHGWCDTGVPCRPLSPPPPPPPPLQCFSCPRAVPMQRFVCSLLPRPGEGEVEAAALSVFGRLRNSFWLPVTGPAAPVDSGNVIQLAVVPARPGGARRIRPMGVWWSLNNMGKLRHGASVPGTLYLQPGGEAGGSTHICNLLGASVSLPCAWGSRGLCPMLGGLSCPSWPVGRRRA